MPLDELLSLPVVVDLPTAGRAFGIGRDLSYRLAASGEFPCPVLRIGRHLRVTRAALLAALGVPDTRFAAPSAPDTPPATEPATPVEALALDWPSGAVALNGTALSHGQALR